MQIIDSVKKYKKALDMLSKKKNINKYSLYIDCIFAYFYYGCVLNQYIEGKFYNRRSFDRKKIFTYKKWENVIKLNDKNYISVLKDKAQFNKFYKKFIGREWLSIENVSQFEFLDFFKKHTKIFVKPADGLEGVGCKILEFSDDNISHIYELLKKQKCIVEEVIVQHHDMIYNNKSVNTIRIYTLFDDEKNECVLLKTTLRVGIGDSVVDNSHSGGVAYEIDLDLGIISSGGWCHGIDDQILCHPKSPYIMPGRIIPWWEEVKKMIKEAHEMLPQIKYIGWDVAITESGPILIEGNHLPDLDIMEFVGNYGYYNKIKTHLKLK